MTTKSFWRHCFVLLVSTPLSLSNSGPVRAAESKPEQSLGEEFDLTPKLLAAGQGRTSDDPLKAISTKMTSVHRDLTAMQTNDPVQTKEKQVVRSLDELIKALEQHCNSSGVGRGNKPNSGRKESVIAKGEATIGDLHGVDPNARQWSQLPPKLRQEILQSKTDGFPPGYEALLQSYYQQLAEEKSLDTSDSAGNASKKPAVEK